MWWNVNGNLAVALLSSSGVKYYLASVCKSCDLLWCFAPQASVMFHNQALQQTLSVTPLTHWLLYMTLVGTAIDCGPLKCQRPGDRSCSSGFNLPLTSSIIQSCSACIFQNCWMRSFVVIISCITTEASLKKHIPSRARSHKESKGHLRALG